MQLGKFLRLGLPVLLAAALAVGGCSTVKQWAGYGTDDADEETVPPEAQQETVMIDGKPYVRAEPLLSLSRRPPILYVEKARGVRGRPNRRGKFPGHDAMNADRARARVTIPPDKLQEMVRAEVDRILREQGLGGFVSQGKGGASGIVGRAVAVVPDLDTPKSSDGLNRTLAMALGSALGKTKDLKVSPPESVQEALRKAGVAGKMTLAPNIKALGDALGVQGIVLTGIMPPEGGGQGAMVLQVYDTFTGLQEDAIVAPAASGGVKPDTVTKFAQDNGLRVAGNLTRIAWFGRVEFVKEGKVYLSLGQNSGLKVGDRLKVVEPGKEVVNPKTHSVPRLHRRCLRGRDQVMNSLAIAAASAAERRPLQGQR